MTEKSRTGNPDAAALNILQVIPALDAGGAERTTVDIAAALKEAGGKPVVTARGGRLVEELDALKIPFISLPLESKNPIIIWKNVAQLEKIIRTHNIMLVHARSRAPAWSAYYAAKKCGIPYITTYHGTYSTGGALKHKYNSIMVRGEKVIANSLFIASHVKKLYKLPSDHIIPIPRGSDFSKLDPSQISEDAKDMMRASWGLTDTPHPIILLPGRLTRWKGQHVLVKATAKLIELGQKNFVAVLAGDAQGRDEYESELTDLIAQNDLTGHIKIVGHCSDMPTAYALADVVVSASCRPEAFGRIAVEAQAMEVPVIVTDHGGSKETVLNGQTGWRVPPDDPEALAQALDATLSMTSNARTGFGAKGRAHVLKAYSVEQMCAKTLAVYRDVLANFNDKI